MFWRRLSIPARLKGTANAGMIRCCRCLHAFSLAAKLPVVAGTTLTLLGQMYAADGTNESLHWPAWRPSLVRTLHCEQGVHDASLPKPPVYHPEQRPLGEILYPAIEPYRTGTLRVSDVHTLYYEECGNPAGKPVVLVHGGPGAGCSAAMRRYHDPKVHDDHFVKNDSVQRDCVSMHVIPCML